MRLKRIYDLSGDPARNLPDADGNLPDPSKAEGLLLEPAPVLHVEVEYVGDRQNFSPRFVEGAAMEGWLELANGKFTLRTPPGQKNLTFAILRTPGRYCCHCGEKIAGNHEDAVAHLEENHPGEPSPDPANPAGHRVDNFFACELVS